MTDRPNDTGELRGELFLRTADQQAFATTQIELLKAIQQCGSISKAAKHVGISYKTAWDRIDAMNNMSSQPLVTRSTGGARGGGTTLTELGLRIIDGFESLQQAHQQFIARLGGQLHSLSDIAEFIRSEQMQTSARNQFRGQVRRVSTGAVNTEVELDIGAATPLIAVITEDSVAQLGLRENHHAIALIKASSVLLTTDTAIATSARNKFCGTVSRLVTGAVNSDVTLDIGGGKSVSAVITNASADALNLKQGVTACALFKASSVILMRDE
jgi:molybdate transport system regulatory protein